MLLELADAFAHQKTPPQRSVLFFTPTLEESGLLGSQYYAAKPVFPLDKTVADIAVDALPIIGRAHDMTVIGMGQSQLEDMLAGVLKTQGRVMSQETTPENGFYFRSDHFSFAKAGVPAMLASSGLDLLNGGKAAGQKAADDYTHIITTRPTTCLIRTGISPASSRTRRRCILGQQLSEEGSGRSGTPAARSRRSAMR
jgi:Zn-dependent M28 family amino/carboxypeptidase